MKTATELLNQYRYETKAIVIGGDDVRLQNPFGYPTPTTAGKVYLAGERVTDAIGGYSRTCILGLNTGGERGETVEDVAAWAAALFGVTIEAENAEE